MFVDICSHGGYKSFCRHLQPWRLQKFLQTFVASYPIFVLHLQKGLQTFVASYCRPAKQVGTCRHKVHVDYKLVHVRYKLQVGFNLVQLMYNEEQVGTSCNKKRYKLLVGNCKRQVAAGKLKITNKCKRSQILECLNWKLAFTQITKPDKCQI